MLPINLCLKRHAAGWQVTCVEGFHEDFHHRVVAESQNLLPSVLRLVADLP